MEQGWFRAPDLLSSDDAGSRGALGLYQFEGQIWEVSGLLPTVT